jgi:hypothetical protein
MWLESAVIEWRPIVGFKDYEVSSNGRVRRAIASRKSPVGFEPRQYVGGQRYSYVTLWDGVRGERRIVSRLMLEAFVSPPPTERHQAAHNDGDWTHNTIANLRWATPKDNQADQWKHGTRAWGDRAGRAKLTIADVAHIRAQGSLDQIKAQGVPGRGIRALARRFKVSHSTIHDVLTGTTWIDKAAA